MAASNTSVEKQNELYYSANCNEAQGLRDLIDLQ